MADPQHILIVDDRRENLVALRLVLRELDARVVEATNGNDALREGEEKLRGVFSAVKARAERPNLPVGYMSGDTDDAIARHGVLEPGTVLIEKPFTPEQLPHCLRQVLAAHQ